MDKHETKRIEKMIRNRQRTHHCSTTASRYVVGRGPAHNNVRIQVACTAARFSHRFHAESPRPQLPKWRSRIVRQGGSVVQAGLLQRLREIHRESPQC